MFPIAGTPGLPLIILSLTAPTVVVLLWLSLRFAATSGQRLMNLISGFAFAVGAMIVSAQFFGPPPGSQADETYRLVVWGVAPFGAALGVAVIVGVRFMASRRPRPGGTNTTASDVTIGQTEAMSARSRWQFTLRTLLVVVVVWSCVLATAVFVYDRNVRQPRAFFLAAEAGDADAIRRLLDHGVSVPTRDRFNRTPLMFSCLNGHLEATKLLVEAGAPINERHRHGMTPLMFAAVTGELEVVEYLVAQGADTTLITDSGYSALYYAKGNRHSNVVAFLEGMAEAQDRNEFKNEFKGTGVN